MITIPIYIIDTSLKEKMEELLEENERLGIEKNKINKEDLKPKRVLVDFHFRPQDLMGFWKDPDINDDTKTQDIIFYIKGLSFRTPYNDIKYAKFLQILNENV